MRMVFPSANARDHVIKTYGAAEGLNQTLGRLDAYLKTLQKQGPPSARKKK